MPIQIIGTKKCRDTRAAVRFFKERRVPFHFVDLEERQLSDGEFQSIKRAVGLERMLDRGGKEYQRRQLQCQMFDLEAKLRENPKLLKTPIVRNGSKATMGSEPGTWDQWIKDNE